MLRLAISVLALSLASCASAHTRPRLTSITPHQPGLGNGYVDDGEVGVFFLNVGQGDCTLIVSNDNGTYTTVLFDAGTGIGGSTGSMSNHEIRAFIDDKNGGNGEIDFVVISHADYDHYSRVEEVTDGYAIGEVNFAGDLDDFNEDFQDWLTNHDALTITQNNADHTWGLDRPYIRCGDANIYLLAANVVGQGSDSVRKNAQSAVLLIWLEESRVVLTADANEYTNDFLIEQYDFGEIDLMSAEHHGSGTHGSNGVAILNEIDPDIVAMSVGWQPSSYQVPDEDSLDRLLGYVDDDCVDHEVVYWVADVRTTAHTTCCLAQTATNGIITFEGAADGNYHLSWQHDDRP